MDYRKHWLRNRMRIYGSEAANAPLTNHRPMPLIKPRTVAPSVPKAALRQQASVAYEQFKAAPPRPVAPPRPRLQRAINDLDPRNPHDQLAGVHFIFSIIAPITTIVIGSPPPSSP
jgi:hypothetical protein